MSPLRNIAVVKDGTVRELLRQAQRDMDALGVRLSSLEARLHSLEAYSDASRPTPGSVRRYTAIFNTDDGSINVSDGKDWRDPTGSIT